jgi:hypothetical protein
MEKRMAKSPKLKLSDEGAKRWRNSEHVEPAAIVASAVAGFHWIGIEINFPETHWGTDDIAELQQLLSGEFPDDLALAARVRAAVAVGGFGDVDTFNLQAQFEHEDITDVWNVPFDMLPYIVAVD